jgi:hypothetical protein
MTKEIFDNSKKIFDERIHSGFAVIALPEKGWNLRSGLG